MVSLEISGIPELQHLLLRLAAEAARTMAQAMQAEAERILETSQPLVPVDTGSLEKRALPIVSYTAWPLTYWSCKDLFIRPTVAMTVNQNRVFDMHNLTPFAQTMCFTVQGQKDSATSVSRLLSTCCPTHIARFIVAIVIRVSIQAMLRCRAWPDIFQKCFKRVTPSVTDNNTTPTIARIIFARRRMTAFFHSLPGFIFWAYLSPSCRSVFQIALRKEFISQTATTLYASIIQFLSQYTRNIATKTLTDPCCSFGVVMDRLITMQHCQSSKLLACQISKVWWRLLAQTATTLCTLLTQLIRTNRDDISTITLADPLRISSLYCDIDIPRQDSQFPESLIGQIVTQRRHDRLPSHLGRWLTSGHGIAAGVSSLFSGRDSLAIPQRMSIA